MKDLRVVYKTCNDTTVEKKYDTIMGFIDEMESDNIDIPMLDDEVVEAEFFENRIEHFDTIDDLYKHCVNIVK